MRIEIIFRDIIFFHLQDCTFVDANNTEAVVDNLLVKILNIYEQKFLVDQPAIDALHDSDPKLGQPCCKLQQTITTTTNCDSHALVT